MKILNSLFPLLFLHFACFAGNKIVITGKFKANEEIKIKIYEPVNGYSNFALFETVDNCILNNSDSFYYKTASNTPITLLVYVTTLKNIFVEKSIIIAFPNDSIHIDIMLSDININSLRYSGNNAVGQKLMNDIEYEPISKYLPIFDLLNHLKENKLNFISKANKIINLTTKIFDSLYQNNLITKQFKEYHEVMFTQQLYEAIISKLLNNYKQREVFTKQERDSIIQYFFSRQPITNTYCKGSFNSNLYLIAYYNYVAYKKLGLNSLEPLMENKLYYQNGKTFEIGNFCGQFVYITDKQMQEDLWAIYLLQSIGIGSPTPIIETINQFYEIFPNSKWKAILEKQYAFNKRSTNFEYALNTPIVFIDSSKEIKTLKDVFNKLPSDKAIFLDIWATWCGPCTYAFQFNNALDSFLIENNIEHLYFSLDDQRNEKNWIAAVNKYKLGGYHIISNEFLTGDLKNIYKVEIDSGIEIPKYVLVDKGKNIVLKNATSPVNLDSLKIEINKFLLQ